MIILKFAMALIVIGIVFYIGGVILLLLVDLIRKLLGYN
jgi:hypothetical protein